MTGHSYLGNIDPAFPGNSLCDRISSNPNFRKIYFLITWASQYHHQQIQGNSTVKIFHDRDSWRISSCINAHTGNVPHNSVFSHEFSCKCIASKTT